MQTNFKQLNDQLRVLRKCGIFTTFTPEINATIQDKQENCLKAVALLSGYSASDFITEFWKNVITRVRDEGLLNIHLYKSDGFTQEDEETFAPMFLAAGHLFEIIDGSTKDIVNVTMSNVNNNVFLKCAQA